MGQGDRDDDLDDHQHDHDVIACFRRHQSNLLPPLKISCDVLTHAGRITPQPLDPQGGLGQRFGTISILAGSRRDFTTIAYSVVGRWTLATHVQSPNNQV